MLVDFFFKHMFDEFRYMGQKAEIVAYPLDESWIAQNLLPSYTGAGYIRSFQRKAFSTQLWTPPPLI